MPDEFDKPQTGRLKLKPKEIEPMDTRAAPGDGRAISVQLFHAQNRVAEEKVAEGVSRPPAFDGGPTETGVPKGFKVPELSPLDPPSASIGEAPISVTDMLDQNRAREHRSGLWVMKHFTRRPSRRLRDFVLLVVPIDSVVLIVMHANPDPMTLIFGIGAITLLTSTSAWILFFMMDDH